MSGALGALPVMLAALGGGLLAVAAREAVAALPALAASIARVIDPLRR
ncbi:MAG: hypothetical protein QOJ01_1706, partial [Solirubrobacterales bacterium]|nr:hypothetical protein [Solirubrobacterales bacterium]